VRHHANQLLNALAFLLCCWPTIGNATGNPALDSTIVSSDDATLAATGTIDINVSPGSGFTLSDITSTNISVTGTNITPFTFTSWNSAGGTISADGLSAMFDTANNPFSFPSDFFGCGFPECGLGGNPNNFVISVSNLGFVDEQDVLYASADDAVASMHMTAATTATPLPAALPLFATGLGGLGLLGWRRKRKTQAIV
jgi:hypothetical protein